MRIGWRTLVLPTLLLLAAAMAQAQELTIAAAADLQPVMTEIAGRFEQHTGGRVRVSFGSSGNFYSQIQNGAPYDLFFSADVEYPARLEAAGLAEPASLYQYATGRIVLWVPNESSLDVGKGLKMVEDPRLEKLAIANPAHAPYGRAAETALKREGLWEKISSKLVFGENISQAAQFVQSGNADAGILALSLALAPAMRDKGRYYLIPQELYPPLQQASVVLKSSGNKNLAKQFVDFLRTSEIRALLRQNGFSIAEVGQQASAADKQTIERKRQLPGSPR